LAAVPLVKIHLLKKETVGPLARPFKVKSMFDAPTSETGPKEIKAKEKKAAKKKAVGKVE
jgi:hypothetical protein